jgi:hypothetical protein
MAEQAIVFIPDISGFTDFTTATEIDHASHIISELLELLVESNQTGFTLAEVEGDAILFYRTGAPLGREHLVEQCLTMFSTFHQRLMVIERDTVCQCGACQTASDLTLKFIAHFGYVKEIKVARFVKPTGVDMIVAHRLLKNDVDSNEYILVTEACGAAIGPSGPHPALRWTKSRQDYHAIGTVNYEYATLSDYRRQISPPPAPPQFVVEKGPDSLELEIGAPLKAVYQTLINVDKRPEWLDGVATIDREMTSERVGMRHNCVFHGHKLVNTAVFRDFHEDHARYSEQVEIPDIKVTLQAHYEMEALGPARTRLKFNVNWLDSQLPPENKKGLMAGQAANFELLKKVCETNPA